MLQHTSTGLSEHRVPQTPAVYHQSTPQTISKKDFFGALPFLTLYAICQIPHTAFNLTILRSHPLPLKVTLNLNAHQWPISIPNWERDRPYPQWWNCFKHLQTNGFQTTNMKRMKLLELNKSPNLCRRSHQQLRLFPTTCRHLKAWWRQKATFPGKAASSGSNILVICMDRQHKILRTCCPPHLVHQKMIVQFPSPCPISIPASEKERLTPPAFCCAAVRATRSSFVPWA